MFANCLGVRHVQLAVAGYEFLMFQPNSRKTPQDPFAKYMMNRETQLIDQMRHGADHHTQRKGAAAAPHKPLVPHSQPQGLQRRPGREGFRSCCRTMFCPSFALLPGLVSYLDCTLLLCSGLGFVVYLLTSSPIWTTHNYCECTPTPSHPGLTGLPSGNTDPYMYAQALRIEAHGSLRPAFVTPTSCNTTLSDRSLSNLGCYKPPFLLFSCVGGME
jgi:hypothetical protein